MYRLVQFMYSTYRIVFLASISAQRYHLSAGLGLYIFLLNTHFPIRLFNIYFHYRYQGKHEAKTPRQDPHTDNKQVYDVTSAADVFEMKSDIKQTWEHQCQQHTRYTANHCHQQRELR